MFKLKHFYVDEHEYKVVEYRTLYLNKVSAVQRSYLQKSSASLSVNYKCLCEIMLMSLNLLL